MNPGNDARHHTSVTRPSNGGNHPVRSRRLMVAAAMLGVAMLIGAIRPALAQDSTPKTLTLWVDSKTGQLFTRPGKGRTPFVIPGAALDTSAIANQVEQKVDQKTATLEQTQEQMKADLAKTQQQTQERLDADGRGQARLAGLYRQFQEQVPGRHAGLRRLPLLHAYRLRARKSSLRSTRRAPATTTSTASTYRAPT